MYSSGFSLYNDMLSAAIASLKQGKKPDMAHPLGISKVTGQDRLRIELKYDDLQKRVLAIRNFFVELK